MVRTLAALLAAAALAAPARAAQEPGARPEIDVVKERRPVPAELGVAEARAVADRALGFLVDTQNPDGSWGSGALESTLEMGFSVETYYAWQVASHGLAVLALLECEETPERRAALELALGWLADTRMPARGSDWDVDYTWSALYGFVACVRAAGDPRLEGELRERVVARGRGFLEILERNQVPTGGWAYYDDPPFSQRPKWATSFCTALVLPWLVEAQRLEWGVDPAMIERAKQYVRRCALPNGAYEYDLRPVPRVTGGEHINDVKGSLGRIQVCNWALRAIGVPALTLDRLREGVAEFFEHHRFLDVARMRPIPHEAYYANAGYFYFFGHYYAAQAINLLPEGEREAWHAKLRPHVAKAQREDGSTSDFLSSSYMITASTAYSALTLCLGLPEHAAPQPPAAAGAAR